MSTDPTHGLTVQQADALWDAVAVPGQKEPRFVEQHGRVCRTVADLLGELTAEREQVAVSSAAVPTPPAGQAALRKRIAEALKGVRVWRTVDGCDGWEYVGTDALTEAVAAILLPPADRAAVLTEAADAVFALDYDVMVGEEGDENLGSMREAWDLGTIHADKLLRRLAEESTVTPPPALTEVGRLRAQVEVLQQDAERDQGLAKVGARCMRVGHQGLIEHGRGVIEGWRFALSTALGLDAEAPWEAIHERVKELRRLAAEAPEPATQAEAPGGSPRPVIEHALTAYGYSPDIARTLIDRLTAEQGDQ